MSRAPTVGQVADLPVLQALPATASPKDAASRTWDVIVIGAGPAGSVAAGLLAASGLSVLLIERKAFPREKVCGGCLSGVALSLLRQAGLDDAVTRLGGEPVNRFELRAARRRVVLPLSHGLAVSRSAFDASLVAAAIARGAAFLPEATASVLPLVEAKDAKVREVKIRPNGGDPHSIHARVVIAADGLGSPSLQSLDGFESAVVRGARVGFGGAALADDAGIAPGTILMAVARGGYAGLVRHEQGRINVAAAVDPGYLRLCGTPAESVQRIFEQSDFDCPFDPASIDWHGTPPLTRRRRRVADDRLFILGDACGYVEPFTGEGIAWAIGDGLATVPLALRGIRAWDHRLAAEWTALRTRSERRRRWCRILAATLRSTFGLTVVMGLLSQFPRLAAPIVREIHGGSASDMEKGPAEFAALKRKQ